VKKRSPHGGTTPRQRQCDAAPSTRAPGWVVERVGRGTAYDEPPHQARPSNDQVRDRRIWCSRRTDWTCRRRQAPADGRGSAVAAAGPRRSQCRARNRATFLDVRSSLFRAADEYTCSAISIQTGRSRPRRSDALRRCPRYIVGGFGAPGQSCKPLHSHRRAGVGGTLLSAHIGGQEEVWVTSETT
jgi:hypothetical protein